MKKEEKAVQAITNEIQKNKFNSELGSKAIVERVTLPQDERTEQLGEVLQDIGKDFLATGKAPKGMKYLGSIAAHVYVAELTGTFANIKQIRPEGCPNELLIRLGEDLAKGVLEYTGKKSPKLRSGW